MPFHPLDSNGGHTPLEMGEGFEPHTHNWTLCPPLNVVDQRGAKANMASTETHGLEGWTFPLAAGTHGVLGEDI